MVTMTQAEMNQLSDHIETVMTAHGIDITDQSIIAHAISAHVLSAFAQGIAEDVQSIKDQYGMEAIKSNPDVVIALTSGIKLAEQALAEAHQNAAIAFEQMVLGGWESLNES